MVKSDASACIPFGTREAPLGGAFRSGESFTCTQGPRGPAGRTHSFWGDSFAVDLRSTGNEGATIVAPMSGDAVVYDACEERASDAASVNNSRCGLGYGNHVKIWNGQYLVLLAHLSRVTIRDGHVNVGDAVGIEGNSGAAGPRHVHVSTTRLAVTDRLETILRTPGFKGSVPVRVRLVVRETHDPTAQWVDVLACDDHSKHVYTFD